MPSCCGWRWVSPDTRSSAHCERLRMALLTFTGIWPLVSLALLVVAPRLAELPFPMRTGVMSALLVLAMTYLVMPRLARVAAPSLQPRA
jgi:antibiotic biosynthesis monooxygenase (ABM) superfamily enzyme